MTLRLIGFILSAPVSRGPLLRVVMLSISIFCYYGLIRHSDRISLRFQSLSTLIRSVFVIHWIDPDFHIRASPIYSVLPSLHAAILYPVGPFRCFCLFLHETPRSSPINERLDTRYPAHAIFHRYTGGQLILRGCNVYFMVRPADLLAPLKWPSLPL